jgi:histidinol-phosphate/aromatic aminotransferase/cobyric acid decarboxylase-like protein
VKRASPSSHGGPNGQQDERLPVRIDCSTSINAYGPARSVVAAMAECIAPDMLAHYPDPQCWSARTTLALAAGLTVQNVVIGAGAAELIYAICAARLKTGDRVLVPNLAFSEYERAARLNGARMVLPSMLAPSPEILGLPAAVLCERFCDAIERDRPAIAFLCSPANPTGRAWSQEQIRAVFEACVTSRTLLVFDQAYDAFTIRPLGTPVLPIDDHVIHVRSLTKDHALAGVRVAYALATEKLVRAIDAVRPPWSVSTMAQAAAIATTSPCARAHVETTTAALRESAGQLVSACAGFGMEVAPTDTHYFVAGVPRGFMNADALRGALLEQHGIKLRDCASFGLPRHVRIAARTTAETAAVAQALESTIFSAAAHRRTHGYRRQG